MKDFINTHFRRRARAFREIGAAFEVQRAELDHLKVQLAELTGTSEALLRELRSVEALTRIALDSLDSLRLTQGDLRQELADLGETTTARDARLRRILFDVRSRHAENRERLFRLRETPEYEEAYATSDPLVSVIIPTYDRIDALMNRALPSVLAQTHKNVEVIVVGDGSPPIVGDTIRALADPRVRYLHQTVNGPYPPSTSARWFIKGSPGVNIGLLSARGEWVSFFADDDRLHPNALASTLEEARRARLEICYGKVRLFLADGRVEDLGAFPPDLGGQGLQGAVVHAGLAFLQHEIGDGDMEIANDWSFMTRALHLGVHVGMVDTVLADWFDEGVSPEAPEGA